MRKLDLINRTVYENKDVVATYRLAHDLQEAEKAILHVLKDQLQDFSMLDIGVGAGRTTVHFLPLVKKYVGIDYSVNMIKACQERFGNSALQRSFQVCDVRFMSLFEDHSFDFVLFSFNGVDYMDHVGRIKAFEEIRRVGRPRGTFCFSTHNFYYLENMLKVGFCKNPINFFRLIKRQIHVKAVLNNAETTHVILNDGGEDFRVQTYYIKPSAQMSILNGVGFRDIRVFCETNGNEIKNTSTLDQLKENRWFYYLCQF